jgi:nicotinamide mononucleotide transporter
LFDSSWLEIVAVIFGLLSVWYAKKANILVYPTGIVSVLIYVYICLNAQLYADMGINAFYFVMSVYGWFMWTRKVDESRQRPITFSNKKDYLISIAMFIFSLFLIFFLLKYLKGDDTTYWENNVPYIDIFTTSVFIVGMWQMAMKKVENWIFWIIGDVISVPLYFYKGLVFTSLQFVVFLIIAVLGYLEWKKHAEKRVVNA